MLHFCYSSILPRNALKLGLESIKVLNNVFSLLPRARLAPDWWRGVRIRSLIGWTACHSSALPELRLSARNPALVISHALAARSNVISRNFVAYLYNKSTLKRNCLIINNLIHLLLINNNNKYCD